MSRQRLHALLSGLVGAALAVNALATAFRLRRDKAAQRRYLGEFVDDVTRIDATLRPLRPRLAARDHVWYVSRPRNHQLLEVQYALVPTVLRWRGPRPTAKVLVLANLPAPGALDEFLEVQPHELRWRKDGMALLRQR